MPKLILREDQEQKVQRVLAEPTKSALIADDMGKGKTLVAAEVALRLALRRTLIVGIRDTSKQWAETIAGQSDGAVQLRVMNSTEGGQANFDAFMTGAPGIFFAGIKWLTTRDWEVREKRDHNDRPTPVLDKKTGLPTGKNETESIHTELFRRKLVKLKTIDRSVDMVIFDEVHNMQNRDSQTARTITSIRSTWMLGLSGTFAGNSFQGAWKVTRWLWPDLIDRSFNRWKEAWCTTVLPTRKDGSVIPNSNPYGDNSKIVGEKVEGEFVKTLPCYIRDEPDPVPPARIVLVQLTPAQREQYTSLEQTSVAWLQAHTPLGRELLVADLPITQQQRLRTATLAEMSFDRDGALNFALFAPSSKLNALKHIIDNIWTQQPVLIGLYSSRFAQIAAERLKRAGYGAAVWHGGVPAKERERIKQGFMASDPEYRYLVATIPSIGTGVDGLQKACSKIAWLERSENRADNLQFVKRILRPGMTSAYGPFEHVELVASGTIDEGILARQNAANRSMAASLRAA